MHIQWLIDHDAPGPHQAADLAHGCTLASTRLRAALPAIALQRRGHHCALSSPDYSRPASHALAGDIQTLVVSKLAAPAVDNFQHRAMHWLDIVAAARQRRVLVVADICDNHFPDADFRSGYMRALCRRADVLSTSTPALQEIIRRETGRDAILTPDPLEGSRRAPHFQPGDCLKLLWFGHPGNIPTLHPWLAPLSHLARVIRVDLSILTAPGFGAEGIAEQVQQLQIHEFQSRFIPWSLRDQAALLAQSDAVIIPSKPEHEAYRVKSPNRLVEALWTGCFVAASPLPAYRAFREYAYVGDDLVRGLRDALESPVLSNARIAKGQDMLEQELSPDACALHWEKAVLCRPDAIPPPTTRLNLGCGDKILEGYVNIDAAPSRRGLKPDLICDLRAITLPANHADEVLSVHVIEHFWRWEALDVLREWLRVLRPGGTMILECPNLIAACEALLRDPVAGSQPDQRGQRTMWVFYGDPAWQDPLMVHRWGYTPESLAALMREAGLINVRQEPAQFKLREPRDMRLVGTKPLLTGGSAAVNLPASATTRSSPGLLRTVWRRAISRRGL